MTLPAQMRDNASTGAAAVCAYCRAIYSQRRSWQRFCGPACRQAFHQQADTLENRVRRLEEQVEALIAIVNP